MIIGENHGMKNPRNCRLRVCQPLSVRPKVAQCTGSVLTMNHKEEKMLFIDGKYTVGDYVAHVAFVAPDTYTKLEISLQMCEWARVHGFRVPEGKLSFVTTRKNKVVPELSHQPAPTLY